MDNKDFEELEEDNDYLVDNDIKELPSEEVIEDNNDFYNQNLNNQIRNIRRQNKGNQNTINRLRQRNANTMTKGVEAPKSTPSSSNEEENEEINQSSDKNIGQKISDKAKEKVHQAKETAKKAVKKAVKSVAKKIALKILSNPYVLAIIGVCILIMLVPIFWAAFDSDSGSNSSLSGFYDEECNLNNTKVDIKLDDGKVYERDISLEDYILGVVYAEIGSDLYAESTEEAAKTQIVIAKSYSLRRGKYDSEKKRITIKASTQDQAWCDIYSGCMYYSTTSTTHWYYSIESGISKPGARLYKPALNEINLSIAKERYKSVEDIFLVDKNFSGEIKTYNDIAETGFVDYTQNFFVKKGSEGKKYNEIIKLLGTNEYYDYALDQTRTGKSKVSMSHAENHIKWFSNIKLYALKEFCTYTPGSGICTTRFPLDEGTYYFTSGYGPRWGTIHEGVDYAAPIGTPIYAVADGVVVKNYLSSSAGNYTVIGHDLDGDGTYDYYTEYMHQNELPSLSVGESILGGQQFGIVGTTGFSTGPHLHFGLENSSGTRIDPMETLEKLKTKTSVFDKASRCQ